MEARRSGLGGPRRRSALAFGLLAALVVAGCGGEVPNPQVPAGGSALPAPNGGPGPGQPVAQTNCTKQASDPQGMERVLTGAQPGDRICLSGDMRDTRLDIERSGTLEQPILILGGGRTVTDGISVSADHVMVDGVATQMPKAPGFSLQGDNITVQNSTVISPRGGDGDGIRFFGNNIRILHNLVRDTAGTGDDNHADAIQTFVTTGDYVASQNILIDGNRFEQIDNICLIAQGPETQAGNGSGKGNSENFMITNNFCANNGNVTQAYLFDDIANVSVVGNEIVGKLDKAFMFTNDSVGAVVRDNKVDQAIDEVVSVDDSSKRGYEGPEPGSGP